MLCITHSLADPSVIELSTKHFAFLLLLPSTFFLSRAQIVIHKRPVFLQPTRSFFIWVSRDLLWFLLFFLLFYFFSPIYNFLLLLLIEFEFYFNWFYSPSETHFVLHLSPSGFTFFFSLLIACISGLVKKSEAEQSNPETKRVRDRDRER